MLRKCKGCFSRTSVTYHRQVSLGRDLPFCRPHLALCCFKSYFCSAIPSTPGRRHGSWGHS